MSLIRWAFTIILLTGLSGTAFGGVLFNDRFEEPFEYWVPCADGGNGEFLVGTISFHLVMHETFDKAGGYHFGATISPYRTVVTGEITGDVYRALGATQERFNVGFGDLPFSYTFTNHEIIVGKGRAANLTLRETVHLTVNAGGQVTADIEHISLTCN